MRKLQIGIGRVSFEKGVDLVFVFPWGQRTRDVDQTTARFEQVPGLFEHGRLRGRLRAQPGGRAAVFGVRPATEYAQPAAGHVEQDGAWPPAQGGLIGATGEQRDALQAEPRQLMAQPLEATQVDV